MLRCRGGVGEVGDQSLTVRNVRADEAPKVKTLRLFCMRESPTRFGSSLAAEQQRTVEGVQEFLSQPGGEYFIVGGFSGDELVAMAGFTREQAEKTRHKAHVFGVYVMPEHRGRGLSTRIMQVLVQRASQVHALRTLLLTVSADATAARHVYQALGFREFGSEPDALRIGDISVDEVLMRLELGDHSRREMPTNTI